MRKNLIEKRTVKKMTQADIAKLIGITTRQYSRLEAGTSGEIKRFIQYINRHFIREYHKRLK